METYELDICVYGRDVWDWFNDREHEMVFSNCERLEILDNMCYFFCDEVYCRLPNKDLIMLGLKHTGLLNCPGIQGYYIKEWDDYECIVTVEIELLTDKDCESINGNSIVNFVEIELFKRERNARDRIRKFFSPIAVVKNCDQGEQSVGCGH